MVVGKADVDPDRVRRCLTKEQLITYAISMVPEIFRHVSGIVDNQTYLICLCLRRIDAVPWSIKRPLLDEVMQEIHIVGYSNYLFEAESLLDFADMEAVGQYRKVEGHVN